MTFYLHFMSQKILVHQIRKFQYRNFFLGRSNWIRIWKCIWNLLGGAMALVYFVLVDWILQSPNRCFSASYHRFVFGYFELDFRCDVGPFVFRKIGRNSIANSARNRRSVSKNCRGSKFCDARRSRKRQIWTFGAFEITTKIGPRVFFFIFHRKSQGKINRVLVQKSANVSHGNSNERIFVWTANVRDWIDERRIS